MLGARLSVTPLTGVLPVWKERAVMRLRTTFFEPMLAPPGPIQPQEVRESGTTCSPSPTGMPRIALTCCGVRSAQASPVAGGVADANAPEASVAAAANQHLPRVTRTTDRLPAPLRPCNNTTQAVAARAARPPT